MRDEQSEGFDEVVTEPAAQITDEPSDIPTGDATPEEHSGTDEEDVPDPELSPSDEPAPEAVAAATEPSIPVVPDEERGALLQALLFAHAEPLSISRISEVTGWNREEVEATCARLSDELAQIGSGVELAHVAAGMQLRTKSKFGFFIRALKAEKPKRLSAPALETLAIIAYRQPVVKSDIEKIRGVDTTPTLKTLLERNLIRIVGYQNTVGQPALYATTDEFLKVFGLRGLPDLPSLREVMAIERDPGEVALDEPEVEEVSNG
jgi:segregation and condensation protein B